METKNQDRISELVEKKMTHIRLWRMRSGSMQSRVFRSMSLQEYNRNILRLADFQSGQTLPGRRQHLSRNGGSGKPVLAFLR